MYVLVKFYRLPDASQGWILNEIPSDDLYHTLDVDIRKVAPAFGSGKPFLKTSHTLTVYG